MAANILIMLLVCTTVAVRASKISGRCPLLHGVPCDCELVSGPYIFCESIENDMVLQTLFDELKDYDIPYLSLTDVNTTSFIPLNVLNSLNVEELDLVKIEVSSSKLNPKDYGGDQVENSLKVLQIVDSFKQSHPLMNFELDNLKNLKLVQMADNNIPVIGNDWFKTGPKSLDTVFLDSNRVTQLGDKVFQSLDSLAILFLKNNPLKNVSRSMFPSPAKSLVRLDLSNNSLTKLPKDLFSNMPKLNYINLAYNKIMTIEGASSIPKNAQLILQGNILHCNDQLKDVCPLKVDFKMAHCYDFSKDEVLSLEEFCKS